MNLPAFAGILDQDVPCKYCTDIIRSVKKIILAMSDFCPYDTFMKTTPRSGRPRKPAETVKGEYIEVRLGADEKKAFQDAADLAGMALSVWVRQRLRKASQKELVDADMPVAFLERLSA